MKHLLSIVINTFKCGICFDEAAVKNRNMLQLMNDFWAPQPELVYIPLADMRI